MTRVLVVDDHAAVRAGLIGLLRREPGIIPLAAVGTAKGAIESARRHQPELALIDYQLPDGDGLTLCRDLKQLPEAPSVLLYSAFARPALAVAAKLAGADGMLDKGVEVEALFQAIRSVRRGESALPPLPPEMVSRCSSRLDPDDVPIFGMLMNDTPIAGVATTLGAEEGEIEERLRAMLPALLAESAHGTNAGKGS